MSVDPRLGASTEEFGVGTAAPRARSVAGDRYLLLDVLGRGASGVVYSAYDRQLERKIAVKLLGSETGTSAMRLLREGKALARLRHPNVVTVFDAGTLDDKLFVAMELVDGQTLRAWLAERPRDWREILAVFSLAGQGLAAAHHAGLIHRDFKPDNVLCGKDGAVRVADFGLARLTADAPDGETPGADPETPAPSPALELTLTVGRVGTPRYMPPEQHAGTADARSDQFSFCVALSEALSGSHLDPAARGETRPPPPWLAAAVKRGLSPDPAARWPSMDALLAELSRNRELRRRRALALAAAALSTIGAAGITSWVASQRPDSCGGDSAVLDTTWNPARAAALGTVLRARPDADRIVAALDDYAAAWRLAQRDACLAGMRREQPEQVRWLRQSCLDRNRAQLDATATLLLTGEPAILARAAQAIAGLPRVATCSEPLEGLAMPQDAVKAVAVNGVRADLAWSHAAMHFGKGEPCARQLPALAARADALGWDPLRSEVLLELGDCHSLYDDLSAAELAYRASFEAGLAGGTDGYVAIGMARLASRLSDAGRLDEAARWIGLARAIAKRVGRDNVTLRVDESYAWVLKMQGKLAEAETVSARVVEGYAPGNAYNYAGALVTRSAIQLEDGRHSQAEASARQAVEILERVAPSSALHSTALQSLANIRLRLGDLDGAEAVTRLELYFETERFGADHLAVVPSLQSLAQVLRGRGDLEGALAVLERARGIWMKAPNANKWDLGELIGNMAMIEAGLGHLPRAIALAEESRVMMREVLGAEHPRMVPATQIVGTLVRMEGRVADSAPLLVAAYALAQRVLPVEHPDRVNAAVELALTELALDHAAAAAALLGPAVELLVKIENPANLAEGRFALARALWQSGGDRPRALAAATAARDGYTAIGPGFEDAKVEVDTWLAAHPRP